MHLITKIPAQIIELIIITVLAVCGTTLAIDKWRENVLLPFASLFFGTLFGYVAIGPDNQGSYGVVFMTLIGVVVGPNIVVLLSGDRVIKSILTSYLRRFGVEIIDEHPKGSGSNSADKKGNEDESEANR